LEYNIYCDESCHLEFDKSNCMVLGAVECPKSKVHAIAAHLRTIKEKHHLSSKYELKWTKVSPAKIAYYKEIINYFSANPDLSFRALIADKTHLNHQNFLQTHDDWYYKMYYLLLRALVLPEDTYRIYLDIKDTNGGQKVLKLKEVLNHSLYKFYDETVLDVKQIRSHESELLQLSDFLIGAICYANRHLTTSACKLELCQDLETETLTSLSSSTPLSNTKFNVFIWNSRC